MKAASPVSRPNSYMAECRYRSVTHQAEASTPSTGETVPLTMRKSSTPVAALRAACTISRMRSGRIRSKRASAKMGMLTNIHNG